MIPPISGAESLEIEGSILGENFAAAVSMSAGNGRGKIRLLTKDALDQRTKASKDFEWMAKALARDFGGWDRLMVIDQTLIEAYVGCFLQLRHLNVRQTRGEKIDTAEYTQLASTMTRIRTRLPSERVSVDVNELDYYLKARYPTGQPIEGST